MPRNKQLFDKQNDYNRERYDRFSLMLPKGEKERLQEIAKESGLSLNAFVGEAIKNEVIRRNRPRGIVLRKRRYK